MDFLTTRALRRRYACGVALFGCALLMDGCSAGESTSPPVLLGPVIAAAPLNPVASYTMITQGPVAKSILTVDGSASSDPNAGGGITNYAWTWGDGTAVQNTGTTPKAVHAYQAPGTFTLGLTVTNTASLTNTATQSITVAKRDTFTISFAPTTPAAGQSISFTPVNAAPPAGDTSSFQWTFPGKVATQYSSLAAPTGITYDSAGTWTVRVQRSYRSGPRQIITQPITIGAALAPSGTISCAPTAVSNGTAVTCSSAGVAANSGSLAAYAWTETGGTPATGTTAAYGFTWNTGASLTPTLVATNTYGKNASFPFTLTAAVTKIPILEWHEEIFGACVITNEPTKRYYCWGANSSGQYADGTLGTPAATDSAQVAWKVSLPSGGFASFVGGGYCGLTAAGKAYCWADNGSGELGNGTTNTTGGVPTMTAVSTAAVTTWSKLFGGDNGRCGIALAAVNPANNKRLYCWGSNYGGSVGMGSTAATAITTPTIVTSTITTWSDLTYGTYNTCALTTAGVAWCWGDGTYGGIGNNTTTANNPNPVLVSGSHVFTKIATTGIAVCAIESGTQLVWCWGFNTFGAVGDGTTTNRLVPTRTASALPFTDLEGASGTMCGLSGGKVYCWGRNSYGEFGNGQSSAGGSTMMSTVPVAAFNGLAISQLRAHQQSNRMCGLETGTNQIWCAGYNTSHELGNPGPGETYPTKVIGLP